MRTALTMLGIVIGVAVVILVVAIGQGATKSVTDAVNSLGTNLLSIRPGRPRVRITAAVTQNASGNATASGSPNRLTLDDARVIGRSFPETILAVAPMVNSNIQIRLNGKDATSSLLGSTPDYLFVNNAMMKSGRMFLAYEGDGAQKVCVVGTAVADKLLGDAKGDLTGQTILLNRQSFLILGMLAPKGSGAFGQNQDDVVLMPIQTAMRRVMNTNHLNMLAVRCKSPEAMPLAQQQISNLLRSRHHTRPPYPDNDDFQVMSQTELMERQQSVTGTMTTLLSAVAVISLVVGGIGIMNIMLVSVTERTREIGIRKAVGANPRDIMMQFLIESSIMSLLGGL
ncbi:ABC transporter permease, partial [Armatimonas sp.]|uniref:ABC transporter permease n=1 Tax=Armatimonas sp. TaxID=1872638 RepID=UPI00286CC318